MDDKKECDGDDKNDMLDKFSDNEFENAVKCCALIFQIRTKLC